MAWEGGGVSGQSGWLLVFWGSSWGEAFGGGFWLEDGGTLVDWVELLDE